MDYSKFFSQGGGGGGEGGGGERAASAASQSQGAINIGGITDGEGNISVFGLIIAGGIFAIGLIGIVTVAKLFR